MLPTRIYRDWHLEYFLQTISHTTGTEAKLFQLSEDAILCKVSQSVSQCLQEQNESF